LSLFALLSHNCFESVSLSFSVVELCVSSVAICRRQLEARRTKPGRAPRRLPSLTPRRDDAAVGSRTLSLSLSASFWAFCFCRSGV
jgi:hypothetical protein